MSHSDDFNEKYALRTKKLSLAVIQWYAGLKVKTDEIRIMGKQLIRSITSSAANFRAYRRARSAAERFAKLCIVVEEIDESVFWLELLQDSELVQNKSTLITLHQEAMEILKVMAITRRKLKR